MGKPLKEDGKRYQIATNLLTPNSLTEIRKREVEQKVASKISPMPSGLLDVLTKQQILDLHAYVAAGGLQLPNHGHQHH